MSVLDVLYALCAPFSFITYRLGGLRSLILVLSVVPFESTFPIELLEFRLNV